MTKEQNGNIAAHLPAMAERQPDALAVAVQEVRGARITYSRYTFKELDTESDRLALGLEHSGITRMMRTVLMVKPSLDFFALTFALFKVGAIPVLVDPGMGLKNLKTCLTEAAPEAFIGIPKAHAARLVLGWGKATLRHLITVGPKVPFSGPTLDTVRRRAQGERYVMAPSRHEELAAILFTSGSTGVPKGAVYTHGVFNAQIEILRDTYGIAPGEKDLATFPLFALFGPALGMAAIVPDMDASKPAQANPANIVAAVRGHGATNMFASPALIDVVGRYGEANGAKLPSLRRVISAGAPARLDSLRRFKQLLNDEVQIWPSYGATEALPVTRIGSDELLGETSEATDRGAGICVGRPVSGVGVSIIRITDEPIPTWTPELASPPGEIGEIVVRGPVVTQAYYNRPDSTAQAKIRDHETGTICHRMGDVGYFGDAGRLWMCGRKAHRVVTPEGTLFTLPCERIFDTHPAVRRTALVGVEKKSAMLPVLCVERNGEHPELDNAALRTELLALGAANPITAPVKTILFHRAFPVDVRHNAKIFREKLAVWAREQLT